MTEYVSDDGMGPANPTVYAGHTCDCLPWCCFLDGCCQKKPALNYKSILPKNKYTPVPIQTTHSARAHPGRSFLDLPAELRNTIYGWALDFKDDPCIPLSLDPNPGKVRGPHDMYGIDNKFALLSTSREVYHEAKPMLYGQKWNTFILYRPYYKDNSMPRATLTPDMPWHLIVRVVLEYPPNFGPCEWNMEHCWGHFIDDANAIIARFRNLQNLHMIMEYDANPEENGEHVSPHNVNSWDTIFVRTDADPQAHARKMREVVIALNKLHGKKMPPIVSFRYRTVKDQTHARPGHDQYGINHGIIASGRPRGAPLIPDVSWD